jgi:WD40 repeat protein
MAEIFISYDKDDSEHAAQAAEALAKNGWDVWWDVQLRVGSKFREAIATELRVTRCVLVLWSRHSLHSDYVIDEADEGRKRKILVQAIVERDVTPPHGFGQYEYADLSGWKGDVKAPEFTKLLRGFSHLVPPRDPTAAGSILETRNPEAILETQPKAVRASSRDRPPTEPLKDRKAPAFQRPVRPAALAEIKRAQPSRNEMLERDRAQAALQNAPQSRRTKERASSLPAATTTVAETSSSIPEPKTESAGAPGQRPLTGGEIFGGLVGLVVIVGMVVGLWYGSRYVWQRVVGSSTNPPARASVSARDTGFSGRPVKPQPEPLRATAGQWTGSGPIRSISLEALRTFTSPVANDQVNGIAFSPDGKLLASAWEQVLTKPGQRLVNFAGNGSVRLWDIATGELVGTLQSSGDRKNDNPKGVSFSPDGHSLAVSFMTLGEPTPPVQLWDVDAQRLSASFPVNDAVRQIAFSPDGALLAAACDDGLVYVWNARTHAFVRSLKHPYIVVSVAFNPRQSDMLAAGDYQQSVRIWDVLNGSQPRVLRSAPPSYGESVAFSPDGKLLATGHASGTLLLWDVGTWTVLRRIAVGKSVDSVAFSPDGRILAAIEGSMLHLWNAPHADPIGTFDITGDVPASWPNVVFHPTLQLAATQAGRNAVRLWKLRLTGAQ